MGADARWQVTFYNRLEQKVLSPPDSELRTVDGRMVFLAERPLGELARRLRARRRDALQRRSTSGLSGWVSYSLGFNRYHDRVTGEAFDGDFDQRHTFNGYGLYRFDDRYSLAAKLRAGSNVPAVGYWEQRATGISSATRERAAPATIRAPRRSPQPGVHPPREPHLPVRRSAERAGPRERPLHAAWRKPADRSGLRFVRFDDPARAVGGGARRVLTGDFARPAPWHAIWLAVGMVVWPRAQADLFTRRCHGGHAAQNGTAPPQTAEPDRARGHCAVRGAGRYSRTPNATVCSASCSRSTPAANGIGRRRRGRAEGNPARAAHRLEPVHGVTIHLDNRC